MKPALKIASMLLTMLIITVPGSLWAEARIIHVLVALCDNENQGIVPVPDHLGDGNDPAGNLYWGAMYGVSTYLKKHADWSLTAKVARPSEHILERLVFQSKTDSNTWLVADAYAGRYIDKCTEDLFNFASGLAPALVTWEGGEMLAGGRADLLVYMGHNGLMDFSLNAYPEKSYDERKREVAVFSCVSDYFFSHRLIKAGAEPLMTTRQLMAPEAYILAALADGWIRGETPERLHEKVSQAYNRYQKCGIKAARRTFTAPGVE